MTNNEYACLTTFVFLFSPLRGNEVNGFQNHSKASVQHNESTTMMEAFGKQVHDIIDSVEPVKDNSIIYFDLYEIVLKYFAPRMDKISSSYGVETTLYGLLELANMIQIRRRVNTVFECGDEDEILDRIPSTLRKRAEETVFRGYTKSRSSGERPTRREIKGSIDILCVNRHNVQFAINTNFWAVEQNYSTTELAGDCLLAMPLWCESAVETDAVNTDNPPETIYIGVVCDVANGRMCMGFYNPSSDHEPSYVST